MFPDVLADRIRSVLAAAGLPATDDALRVARPLRSEHGDYSSPVALRLASSTGRTPAELAALVAEGLRADTAVEEVTTAAGGHVNVRFTPDDLAETALRLADGPSLAQALAGARLRATRAPASQEFAELFGELIRLVRGAEVLEVPIGPVDLEDLAACEQRQLICLLAEITDVARRRPALLSGLVGEASRAWHRVAAIQPILPKGAENMTTHHSTGRLLATAAFRTMARVETLL